MTTRRNFLERFGFRTELPQSARLLRDCVPSSHPLYPLATRLDNVESRLLSGSDPDMIQLACCIHGFTGVEVLAGIKLVNRPRPVDIENLALMIPAYRVLDAYLAGAGSYPLASRTPRRMPELESSLHLVDDWVELTEKFCRLMRAGGVSQNEFESSALQSGDRLAALAKNKLLSNRNAATSRIFSNLYSCAMYLAAMCDPGSTGDALTVKNVGKSFTRLFIDPSLTTSSVFNLRLTSEEHRGLTSLASPESTRNLQMCLEMGFMLSPILVLRTFDVSKQRWTKEAILQTALCLGNDKPDTIANVEKSLITAVFEVAFAGGCCSRSFTGSIVVMESIMPQTSLADRQWFMQQSVQNFAFACRETPDVGSDYPNKRTRIEPPPKPLLDGLVTSSISPSLPSVHLGFHNGLDQHIVDAANAAGPSHPYSSLPAVTPQREYIEAQLIPVHTPQPQRRHLTVAPMVHTSDPTLLANSDTPSSGCNGLVQIASVSTTANSRGGSLAPSPAPPTSEARDRSASCCPSPLSSLSALSGELSRPPSIAPEPFGSRERSASVTQTFVDVVSNPPQSVPTAKVREVVMEDDSVLRNADAADHPLTSGAKGRKASDGKEGRANKSGKTGGRAGKGGRTAQTSKNKQSMGGVERVVPLTAEELDDVFKALNFSPVPESKTDGDTLIPSGGRKRLDQRWRREKGEKAVLLFDIDGATEQYTPYMCASQLERFYSLHSALETFYMDGKPRHVASPDDSVFVRLPDDMEDDMEPETIRELFTKRFLVTRGGRKQAFNAKALGKLAPLDKKQTLHDYSLGEGPSRYATGTLHHVLAEHERGVDGKIVNVLDLPQNERVEPMALFSDVQAFLETEDCPLPFKIPFPVRDQHWALVATKDAYHDWHFDTDGLCTNVAVTAGLKWWIVAVPPPGLNLTPVAFFGDISHFLGGWQQSETNEQSWRIEAVLLRPGDTLYFPALCLHYVYTIESSICQGGHFYCARTMAESAASKITTLLLEPIITNTKHYASQRLLQLQAIHCYDQLVCNAFGTLATLGYDLETFTGWHSFIMLHVMAVLGPALDRRFFPSHPDYGSCSEQDGLMLAYARGAALATLSHLSAQGTLGIALPNPGGPELTITPQEYLDRILLQQAVNMVEAFDAVIRDKDITLLRRRDRPYIVMMLNEALSYNSMLSREFDQTTKAVRPVGSEARILVSPLPPEGATLIRKANRAVRTGGRRSQIHNSVDLIQQGLTHTLHAPLRRFVKEVLGKVESPD